ncbi:MAG: hypothetical protein LBQ21_06675 [Clostridiales Family XIII bacterium]|jgi:hypothetical protein|nr:hypothetical protein [Clostridiales Family XIII bacterium]
MNRKQNIRLARIAAIIAALLLCTASALPVFAVETTESGDANSTSLTIEYRYTQGEDIPEIPKTITRFGRKYSLVKAAEPVLESMLPRTRTYTYKVIGVVSKQDVAMVAGLGNVSLQPVLASVERKVDKTETITNLPTNEAEYLPRTKEYEISSDAYEGTVTKGALTRAGVEFELTGYDEYGIPDRYTATVVYRGIETYLEPQYYNAEATYTTRTADTVSSYVIIADYKSDDKVTVTTPVIPTSPAISKPDSEAETPSDTPKTETEPPEKLSEVSQTKIDIPSAISNPVYEKKISTTTLIALGAVAVALIAAAMLLLLAGKHREKKNAEARMR